MPSIAVHVPGGHIGLLDNENDHKTEEIEFSGPFGASWTIWILPMVCGLNINMNNTKTMKANKKRKNVVTVAGKPLEETYSYIWAVKSTIQKALKNTLKLESNMHELPFSLLLNLEI